MLYYILPIYYYYIMYHDTIGLYTFFFLLFVFGIISNFAVIQFPKSLTSLFNCGVGIPFFCTSFCTQSKSFSFLQIPDKSTLSIPRCHVLHNV